MQKIWLAVLALGVSGVPLLAQNAVGIQKYKVRAPSTWAADRSGVAHKVAPPPRPTPKSPSTLPPPEVQHVPGAPNHNGIAPLAPVVTPHDFLVQPNLLPPRVIPVLPMNYPAAGVPVPMIPLPPPETAPHMVHPPNLQYLPDGSHPYYQGGLGQHPPHGGHPQHPVGNGYHMPVESHPQPPVGNPTPGWNAPAAMQGSKLEIHVIKNNNNLQAPHWMNR